MNKNIKEKWIDALESGEYVQGRSALRTPDDNFCCLGVLCALYDQENKSPISVSSYWCQDVIGNWMFMGDRGTLPQAVQDWAGLNHPAGRYDKGEFHPWLSYDNDSGKTFKEIANIIREKF